MLHSTIFSLKKAIFKMNIDILILCGIFIVILLLCLYFFRHTFLLDYQKKHIEFTEHLQRQLLMNQDLFSKRMDDLNQSLQVKLHENVEKTSLTFGDVLKRLALIDQAQQKMGELSNQVLDLKTLLADKKARGAFGEMQLAQLIGNLIPAGHYELQALLANGTRVDCLLKLPQPTGNLAIDAKFPLENYQRMVNAAPLEKKIFEQAFRRDIKKHIEDIAAKYIIPGETSEGAVMFIPAESIFADLHSYFPDLIDLGHHKKVFITSPTTLMAVLTTAASVIKEDLTRARSLEIRVLLNALGEDFKRFQVRMDQLSRHIHQSADDVDQAMTSAVKLVKQFDKIERGQSGEL